MTRYAMVIDTRTCIGCGDCVIACKAENKVPDGLNRDWVVELTFASRGLRSQCQDLAFGLVQTLF